MECSVHGGTGAGVAAVPDFGEQVAAAAICFGVVAHDE
jgi:hypothetical protein